MYSVFTSYGLNVGVHPIVPNEAISQYEISEADKARKMGGFAREELMRLMPTDGKKDPVEYCMEGITERAKDRKQRIENPESDDDDDLIKDVFGPELATVVGTKMHEVKLEEWLDYDEGEEMVIT